MSAKPRSSLRTGLIALSTLAASASVLMGLSSGAFMGLTTSPSSNLVNCTQCHAFEHGTGGVELVGAPVRYRPGAVYDFSVRIRDGEQFGAGFELSAESTGGHAGTFLMLCDGGTADGEVCITDLDCPGGACFDVDGTQYAGSLDYVTHTRAGVDASFAGWAAGGGSLVFRARWRAPDSDVGPVTFYASGLAVNGGGPAGDHYYFGHATSAFAHTADVDGDTDVGLSDHAIAAGCLAGPETSVGVECLAADTNGDGDVDLLDMAEFQTFFSGDVATLPAAFVLADAVRGGRLYDKWWLEGGVPEPLFDPPGTNHPLYPVSGGASGSATFRC
ncbi:MAG: choice-of-anchor V domain-containing protein, partial [Phycisphaerae bacterium]